MVFFSKSIFNDVKARTDFLELKSSLFLSLTEEISILWFWINGIFSKIFHDLSVDKTLEIILIQADTRIFIYCFLPQGRFWIDTFTPIFTFLDYFLQFCVFSIIAIIAHQLIFWRTEQILDTYRPINNTISLENMIFSFNELQFGILYVIDSLKNVLFYLLFVSVALKILGSFYNCLINNLYKK